MSLLGGPGGARVDAARAIYVALAADFMISARCIGGTEKHHYVLMEYRNSSRATARFSRYSTGCAAENIDRPIRRS